MLAEMKISKEESIFAGDRKGSWTIVSLLHTYIIVRMLCVFKSYYVTKIPHVSHSILFYIVSTVLLEFYVFIAEIQ